MNAIIAAAKRGATFEQRGAEWVAIAMTRSSRPSPAEIRSARKLAGLTQAAAAALVHTTARTWRQWEAGDRRMHPAFWALFLRRLPAGDTSDRSTLPMVGTIRPDVPYSAYADTLYAMARSAPLY